jgi:hypothetical protein
LRFSKIQMNSGHVGAGRLAIGLSPSPTGPTLPTRAVFKPTALFFSPRDGARGTDVAIELPNGDFGSVHPKVGQSHFVTHLSVSGIHEEQKAKQGVFHGWRSYLASHF